MALSSAIAAASFALPRTVARNARVVAMDAFAPAPQLAHAASEISADGYGLHVVHQDDFDEFASRHCLSSGEVCEALLFSDERAKHFLLQVSALESGKGGKSIIRYTNNNPVHVMTISDKDSPHQVAASVGSAVRSLTKGAKRNTPDLLAVHVTDRLAEHASNIARSAVLGSYTFQSYKTHAQADGIPQNIATVAVPHLSQNQLAEVQNDVTGAFLARSIGNYRGSDLTPSSFADFLTAMCASYSDKVTVRTISGQASVEEAGLGLLAAVGRGANPSSLNNKGPALVHVAYRNAARDAPVQAAFVGKGITFDTGGLNLKPTGAIEGMHVDMGGAAGVLGALASTLGSEPAANVDFVFALAENAIGPEAVKPMDIVQGLNGKTVEVGNTDAEGRLVLADAFTYAQSTDAPPQRIVDVATLTGACVVALGHHAAGLFSNSDQLAQHLTASGDSVQERLWHMPVFPEHEKEITTGSAHADLKSIGAGREAGASTAAAFLKQYVDEGREWAHLDIAGPGMLPKDMGVYAEGASGFAAQTLASYIRSLK